MPRRSLRQPAAPLPALLTHVVRSAEAERRRDAAHWSATSKSRAGNHPATLIDLARIVALSLPANGVLAPGDELCNEIDRVAQRHLNRRKADREFRAAIARVVNVEHRDAIETAHGRLIEVSEVAHYYAGLAAGITLSTLARE
jgi:hypothetical protein